MSAERLLTMLAQRGLKIATAESCSGGLLAAAITDIPGASRVFDCGIISYADAIKMRLLGVPEQTLRQYGAVSEQTALAMLSGLLRLSSADLGLAVTGIAGPEGGSADKPVGLVYIAVGSAHRMRTRRFLFAGNREVVRQQTVETALHMAAEFLAAESDAKQAAIEQGSKV